MVWWLLINSDDWTNGRARLEEDMTTSMMDDDKFFELIRARVGKLLDSFGLRYEGTKENGYIGSAVLETMLITLVNDLCIEYLERCAKKDTDKS